VRHGGFRQGLPRKEKRAGPVIGARASCRTSGTAIAPEVRRIGATVLVRRVGAAIQPAARLPPPAREGQPRILSGDEAMRSTIAAAGIRKEELLLAIQAGQRAFTLLHRILQRVARVSRTGGR